MVGQFHPTSVHPTSGQPALGTSLPVAKLQTTKLITTATAKNPHQSRAHLTQPNCNHSFVSTAPIIPWLRASNGSIPTVPTVSPELAEHSRTRTPTLTRRLHDASPTSNPMPSPFNTIRRLPPRTRMILGVAFLTWGSAGLFLSDSAEEAFGLRASKEDKEALGGVVPRVLVVEREREGGKRKGKDEDERPG